ncbi:haptoglobin [Hippocampus comes]|uniref:Haptoglobin-like n=1 Tax=Hippocampus comes TaxID=109280 RepID=A0A3Q2Y0A4_HIPCM|nr:PREDICTED: haptoglobin-like [Hippocampus comes]
MKTSDCRHQTRNRNICNKMRFSLAALLSSMCIYLVDVTHTEERIKPSLSASKFLSVRSRRMVGGTLAPHVPWQAMVYLNDSLLDGGYAGGALISSHWVLTAGRNLFINKTRQDTRSKDPIIPKVYLGISHRSEATPSKEVAVERVILHPNFQSQSDWDNDLALIQLKHPVAIGSKVIPIPLPESNHAITGASGVITGWGYGIYLTFAASLKHLVLPLVPRADCKAEYENSQYTPTVDENMLCTGPTKYGENVCMGDAGGALAVKDPQSGDVVAAGILSYDKSCAQYKYGVYMELSKFMPWINSVIRGDKQESSALRKIAMAKMYSWQS